MFRRLYKPVIFLTDPPEQGATPQHPGTPAVHLLHMADELFQNLEKKTMLLLPICHQISSSICLSRPHSPDPFLPLSIKE